MELHHLILLPFLCLPVVLTVGVLLGLIPFKDDVPPELEDLKRGFDQSL